MKSGANGLMRKHIPVSAPWLGDVERDCVNDALQKGAISGLFGDYLPMFENEFARYCGCEFGVAVSNGTTALHLGLLAVGVKRMLDAATFHVPLPYTRS